MENTNEQPEPGGLVIYSRRDVWKQDRSPVNYSDIRHGRTDQSRVKNVHLVVSVPFCLRPLIVRRVLKLSAFQCSTAGMEPASIPAGEGGAEGTPGGIL